MPKPQQSGALHDPAGEMWVISPNDDNDLRRTTRGINVATAGMVRVTGVLMTDGQYCDVYLVAGVVHPLRVKRVWDTGTDATGIVGVR